MKRVANAVKRFFFPPTGAPRWIKFLPYAALSIIFLLIGVGGVYTWDYTNSSEFCGTACHSMPPQYITYQDSPHARVNCVECHIGREFVGNQFTRKIGDARHVFATVFGTYEYPIMIKSMRPAREICERCHNPEKFSDDSQRVIFHYTPDKENSLYRTYLILKTGGGSVREGLGRGIHWHIENKVYYYAADELEQEIPYVQVVDGDGNKTEYVDVTSGFDSYGIDETQLKEMDCITCHNRITHNIEKPETAVEDALYKGVIPPAIPEIRAQAVGVLSADYATLADAKNGIDSLSSYYQANHPAYFEAHSDQIYNAVEALKNIYNKSVFPDQDMDWDTHPNNIGHKESPGCFRCHDGKHIGGGSAIRLECNLCHAIPVVAGPEDEVTNIEISHEQRPGTHQNANWLALHRYAYDENDEDETCTGCHDVTNYDGPADNSSFCSNSACHGSSWETIDFDVLDSDQIRRIVLAQMPHYPSMLEPMPEWGEAEPTLDYIHRVQEEMVCEDCHEEFPPVAPPSNDMCISCHGETLAETAKLTAHFEPNPHDWHYGEELPCFTCHQNFGPYRAPCGLCHAEEKYEKIGEPSGSN